MTPSKPAAADAPASVRFDFTTRTLPLAEQALAWRQRVGDVIDMLPTTRQLVEGLGADITYHGIGDMVFTDATTDAMVLERSITRTSSGARGDVVFQLFLDGHVGNVTALRRRLRAGDAPGQLVAFDLALPFRIERPACRVLSLFVPRAMAEAALAPGESLHGRSLAAHAPLSALIVDHLTALNRDIAGLDAQAALAALHTAAHLLLAAFRRSTEISGSGRAAVQSAAVGQIRRFIDANLHRGELTPSMVIHALALKRATAYRWFAHEGGLGAYIRHRRLRLAADELVRYPQAPVFQVAYGLGFNSASDFTRAFRRAFGISPQDIRQPARQPRPDAAAA